MITRIGHRLSRGVLLCCLLALLMTVFVAAPLVNMFASVDVESVRLVFSDESIGVVIIRSVLVSLATTAISLALAFLLALCLERTAIPCKKALRILAVLPMLIPSVSIGMGVVLLFGNNGIFSRMFQLPVGNIYGANGIILGSVLYSFPVAFLMIDSILKLEDAAPYEAARVLGLNRWHRFKKITMPYLKKPMMVVAFSIFSLSFTDYGVPLMVGGKFKTLPVLMYQEVIGQLNFGKGCVYGAMLLIPAIVAFVLDFINQKRNTDTFVIKTFHQEKSKSRDALALAFSVGIALFNTMPIVAFLLLAFVKRFPTDMSFTFDNFIATMQIGGGRYLLNSVIVAIFVALIGVAVAVLVAYYTARTHSRIGKYMHLLGMSMAAVPGVVLGLAFVLLFNGSFLYGTLALLVIVNTAHFFASPYMMMYNAFSKVNSNLEAVASTLGIDRIRLIINVLLPKCKRTVLEMFASFFVNSMMTISAVSFLANSRTRPIALMINQFEAQAQMEYAAVVSIVILAINLIVKVLIEWAPTKKGDGI